MINVALIEDNLNIRKTFSDYFSKSSKIDCVMAVDTVEKFLKFHRDFMKIDIVLLDLDLMGQKSFYSIPSIKQRDENMLIVMYTISDDPQVLFNSLTYGANGYLLKDYSMVELEEKIINCMDTNGTLLSPTIAKKIIDYFQGMNPGSSTVGSLDNLSKKEISVIRYLCDGLTYDEIAKMMGITINGVRYHIKNIYSKLHVNTKIELIQKVNKPKFLSVFNSLFDKK